MRAHPKTSFQLISLFKGPSPNEVAFREPPGGPVVRTQTLFGRAPVQSLSGELSSCKPKEHSQKNQKEKPKTQNAVST